jgi:hypothetical protein
MMLATAPQWPILPASKTAADPLAFRKKMHLSKNDELCGV